MIKSDNVLLMSEFAGQIYHIYMSTFGLYYPIPNDESASVTYA